MLRIVAATLPALLPLLRRRHLLNPKALVSSRLPPRPFYALSTSAPPAAAAAPPSVAGAGEAVALPLPAAALRRLLHMGSGGGGGGGAGEPESVAYRMSMVRRPSSVRKRGLTWNSCSLIGRLDAPVRPYEHSSADYPMAYSFLTVSPSSSSSSSSSSNFTVTLELKGELANVGLKHLKHNDLVYVSGFLRSYHKVSPSGDRNIFYKIQVKELNYVVDQNKKPQDDEDSVNPSPMLSATPKMLKDKKYIDRLHLWQVFFANPYEWWDNRQSKPWACYPDFKHKDTHEKIWLHPDDPPWVRKQLELHDLEVAENGHKGNGRLLKNHNWKAQDFDYSDDEVQHSAEA
ncbi:unnamed protein product [Urochloa humidicola]